MKIIRKIVLVLLWAIAGILALNLIIVLLVQIPAVQNKLADYAVDYVSDKTGTVITLDEIAITFPFGASIHGLYAETPEGDTLAQIGRLSANIQPLALLNSQLVLNRVSLSNSVAYISRGADSTFNFDFFIEAFATTKQDTASSSFDVSIGEVNVKNVRLYYADALVPMKQEANIGALEISFDDFSTLDQDILAREIILARTYSYTYLGEPDVTAGVDNSTVDSTASIPWNIFPGDITLREVTARVIIGEETHMRLLVGKGDISTETFDLDNQVLHLAAINLSRVDYDMLTEETTVENLPDTASMAASLPQTGWDIRINEVDIGKSTVGIDAGSVETKKHFDPEHIHMAINQVNAEDVVFNDDEIALALNALEVYSSGEWYVKNTSGEITWNNEEARVEDFVFETPYSNGEISALLSYGDFAAFVNEPKRADISVHMDIPTAGIMDAWYFVPEIDTNAWFQQLKSKNLSLFVDADGDTEELLIDQLKLTDNAMARVNISGNVKNLLDVHTVNGHINLHELYVEDALAQSFIPDTALPPNITLPAYTRLTGRVRGGLADLTANIHGEIDSGSFDLAGNLAYSDSVNTTYAVNFTGNDIALGHYLQNDSLGNADIIAEVEGRGFALSNREAEGYVVLPRFQYLGYDYDTLSVDAILENEWLSLASTYSDSNLIYDLTGGLTIGAPEQSFMLDLDLEGVDFQALRMVEHDARYTAKVKADVVIDEDDDILGDISITELGAVRKGREAFIDSFIVASLKDTAGMYTMSVRSNLLEADYEGNVSLTDLPIVIRSQVHEYYSTRDTAKVVDINGLHFDFTVNFKRTEILNDLLLPGLTEYEGGTVTGTFNGSDDQLNVYLRLPHLVYNNFRLDTFVIDVKTEYEEFVASVYAYQMFYDTLPINRLDVTTILANDEMNTYFSTGIVRDSTDTADYYFSFNGKRMPDGFTISTPENIAILNGEVWDISPDNLIVKTREGWRSDNFILTHGESMVEVIVDRYSADEKLMLNLSYFPLAAVTGLIQSDTVLVDAIVDGYVQLDSLAAQLTLTDLVVMGNPAGDMLVEFDQDYLVDAFNTDIRWTGDGNLVEIAGIFRPLEPEEQMDLNVNLSPLNLRYAEGFTLNNLREVEGTLQGTASVKGSFKAPAINGNLDFGESSFIVAATGTRYHLRNESIVAVDGDLHFNQFSVYDSVGNRMTLNGEIRNENYTRFDLELDLTAENFSILNAPPEEGAPMSGDLVIDANVKARGRLIQPDISGTVRIEEGTEVNFLLPQQDLKVASYEGTVEFYDQDIEDNPILGREKTGTDTGAFEFLGVNTQLELTMDPEAGVRIVIDEISGDHLFLQGGGQLGLSMDAFGNMTLTGTYQVQDGYYKLNFYDLVQKEFVITPGSSLQWRGNPTDAMLNIQAVYTTRADPSNLFIGPAASEVSGGRVPVNVLLNMRGELLKPELDFDIAVSEDDEGAYGGRVKSRLAELNQNESELNKQVFGLLVLNSFLPEESGGGPDGGAIARASASKILSNQLNKLGDEYLQGVELDVTVDSYEYGGSDAGATDLEIALSKRFLDNRLEVSVGSDVAIEGQRAEQQQATNYIGDVEVTYKLTEDGRLKLQAFRDNEFDDLLAGEVIETGAGIVYTRHYNRISELFTKPEETGEADTQADLLPEGDNQPVE